MGLKKLETSFISKEKIEDNLWTAFQQEPKILTREPKSKVHAEAQMLSLIIKLIEENAINTKEKQEFYIGISLLCCFHCRTLLEKTNEVLSQNGIPIEIFSRGKHDIDF